MSADHMPGMGPLMWQEANRIMHGNPRASGAEPVSRLEALVVDDAFIDTPKYRYRSPAAWLYYQWLDGLAREPRR